MTENELKRSTLGEIIESGEYGFFGDYFFSNMTEDVWNRRLEEYGFEKCGMSDTFLRLEELKNNTECLISVYSSDEISAEKEKEAVKLIAMPIEGKEELPYVIVCPGGGYARQWGLIEGLAIGTQLNKLGYPAFILYYRTAQKPLLPKPMEDLAKAVDYLENNALAWKLCKGDYAVAGFSAGAHLAAEWGTEKEGYRKYGLPEPKTLILGYPAISTDSFWNQLVAAKRIYQDIQQKEVSGMLSPEDKKTKKEAETVIVSTGNFLERLAGYDYTKESLHRYSIDHHVDKEYPPVYLIACEDDPIVPIESSRKMEHSLNAWKIPCKIRIALCGGHSFGVGSQNGTKDWLEEAVQFWRREK